MMEFNIEEYLNSLPNDVEIIDVLNKNLEYLPDLSRFKSLNKLYCDFNKLTSLPVLPESLIYLSCRINKLTSLPILPKNLQALGCSDNQLTSLPILPESLIYLYCCNNQLTSLTVLPKNLIELYCSNNKLKSLPILPESLKELFCYNNGLTSLPVLNKFVLFNFNYNPIHKIIYGDIYFDDYDFNILNKNIETWNNFRHLYYCLKYKKRFLKIMEPIIKKKYHPSYLYNLTEDDDLDEILNKW
uniref:Leucine-rich repeat protein n=1 Tax=viral metagenome TaxID=1070528 RepID=A0A6C0H6Z7_9ZZZZ